MRSSKWRDCSTFPSYEARRAVSENRIVEFTPQAGALFLDGGGFHVLAQARIFNRYGNLICHGFNQGNFFNGVGLPGESKDI